MRFQLRQFGQGVCAAVVAVVTAIALLVCSDVFAMHETPQLPDAAKRVALSKASADWLQEHPVVRVGVGPEWPPIDKFAANDDYRGLSATLLDQLSTVLGVRFEVINFPDFAQAYTAAVEGKIDVLPSMARSLERDKVLLFTQPYAVMQRVFLGRRDMTDFSPQQDLAGRRVVVERGYVTEEILRARYPRATLVLVNSTAEALRAVATKDADLYLGALLPAHFIVEQQLLPNLAVVGAMHANNNTLHFAMHKRAAPLRDAINTVLEAAGPHYLDQLLLSWTPRYVQLQPLTQQFRLSIAEQNYIDQIPTLTVLYRANFAPVSFTPLDSKQPRGFAIDMFERAAGLIGLRYRYVPYNNSDEAMSLLNNGKADIAMGIHRTEERTRQAQFIGPLYTGPVGIVTRQNSGFNSMNALAGKHVAVVRGSYAVDGPARAYPSVRFVEHETLELVARSVAENRADAAVMPIELALRLMAERFPGQLQVSGVVENQTAELHFTTRADDARLAQLLRRAADALSETDRVRIANSWVRSEIRIGVPWQRVLAIGMPIAAALLLIIAGVLYWNRRLKAEVKRRLAAEGGLVQARDHAVSEAAANADFLATMAHEVRTPMTGVVGIVDMLLRERIDPSQRSRLMVLQRSVQSLSRLLNDVLDFSKMRAHRIELTPELIDVAQLVRDIVDEFTSAAQAKGIGLHLELSGVDPAWVMADALRLRQVLGNLVNNALKFTEKGHVLVGLNVSEVAGDQSENSGNGAAKKTQLRCRFRVSDTGIGIPAAAQDQLFKRYARVNGSAARFSGTGLGLAIVRELAETLGGRIELQSNEGHGSTFTVTVDFERAEPPPSSAAGTTNNTGALHLLVVDDNEVNQLVIREMLAHLGHVPITVGSAAAGLKLLAAQHFDAVFTDCNMPDMDGFELTRRIRTDDMVRGRRMTVIGLTADHTPEVAAQCLAAQMDDVLTKPINLERLKTFLGKLRAEA